MEIIIIIYYSIRAVSGVSLSSSGLEEALIRNNLNED